MKAADEPGLVIGGAGAGGLLMFFLKDFFTKTNQSSDANAKLITSLTKDIGLLEAAKERAREKDEEQAKLIDALQKEQRDMRDRILIIEQRVRAQ